MKLAALGVLILVFGFGFGYRFIQSLDRAGFLSVKTAPASVEISTDTATNRPLTASNSASVVLSASSAASFDDSQTATISASSNVFSNLTPTQQTEFSIISPKISPTIAPHDIYTYIDKYAQEYKVEANIFEAPSKM
jgi:hypothetical protein